MTETQSALDHLADSTEKLSIYPDSLQESEEDEGEEVPTPSTPPSQQEEEELQGEQNAGINLAVVHPLEYEWTFWYDKRPQQQKRVRGEQESYESNLRDIGTFGTVEDFWRYYNHMVKPSKIENNSNYHLFKKGIKPMWEDSANAKGGKWVITMKGDRSLADSLWENVILSLVGETLDIENDICGAVFSKRKGGDRIAVWNRSRENETAIMSIGRKMRQLVGVDPNKVQTSYQNHEDSLKSGASYSNPSRYKIN